MHIPPPRVIGGRRPRCARTRRHTFGRTSTTSPAEGCATPSPASAPDCGAPAASLDKRTESDELRTSLRLLTIYIVENAMTTIGTDGLTRLLGHEAYGFQFDSSENLLTSRSGAKPCECRGSIAMRSSSESTTAKCLTLETSSSQEPVRGYIHSCQMCPVTRTSSVQSYDQAHCHRVGCDGN
ncbi:hypothetical protein EVAR_100521_1 [Eumeta japonica]|uniref:Uncharacterized protein n=1 Tax=Eumeta variegata TaxID=151549 RepID=A0A4C2AAT5_EUMVA|nr:hypothetical protein EVAR_100521_1 [Eumeta japonica]